MKACSAVQCTCEKFRTGLPLEEQPNHRTQREDEDAHNLQDEEHRHRTPGHSHGDSCIDVDDPANEDCKPEKSNDERAPIWKFLSSSDATSVAQNSQS